MSRLLLHLTLVLLALAPGSLGVYLLVRDPTLDTPRSTFVMMAIPLLAICAALLVFAGWSLLRDRRGGPRA